MSIPLLTKSTTDSLKGIAILMIVVCHFVGGGFSYRLLTPLGGIGVSIFLFLSGYGLNESFKAKCLANFWKNKILRILLPYLIWSILFLPLSQILYDKIYWFHRYWFIEYIFLWYILFWFTKRFATRYSEYIMLLAALISFFIFPNLMAEQALSFVSGVIFSSKLDSLSKYKSHQFIIVAILLLVCGLMCLGVKQLHFIRQYGEESLLMKTCQLGIKLPIGLSVIILYSKFGKMLKLERFLSLIGILSLEIYLVHMVLTQYISCSIKNLTIISVLTIIAIVR